MASQFMPFQDENVIMLVLLILSWQFDQGLALTNFTSSIVNCFHTETLNFILLPKGFSNCGKVDSYSRSEPRKFIFFHLGEDTNSQPTQIPTETESAPPPNQMNVRETVESTAINQSADPS